MRKSVGAARKYEDHNFIFYCCFVVLSWNFDTIFVCQVLPTVSSSASPPYYKGQRDRRGREEGAALEAPRSEAAAPSRGSWPKKSGGRAPQGRLLAALCSLVGHGVHIGQLLLGREPRDRPARWDGAPPPCEVDRGMASCLSSSLGDILGSAHECDGGVGVRHRDWAADTASTLRRRRMRG